MLILRKLVYKRTKIWYNKWVRKNRAEVEYALVEGII